MMMEGAISALDSTMALRSRARFSTRPYTRLRLMRLDALGPKQIERWDRLGAQAGVGSIFAQPWFMRRSLEHFGRGPDVLLGFVEDRDGEWLGALPLENAFRMGRVPFPHWKGWDHPNQFIGSPLVRRETAEAFWKVLLAELDRMMRFRFALRFTNLPLDDAATLALFRVCEARGREMMVDTRFRRAKLVTADKEAAGWHRALAPSFRRRIEGLGRKLEREVGPIEFLTVSDPVQAACWRDRFLALEHSGWKGLAGSSLASRSETAGFFTDVTGEAARRGELEIAVLRAGGKVLAISTYFIRGCRGFGFKMAYDQEFGRYGPGLLLMHHLTARLIDGGVSQFDSCSAPDQEPISNLWPERREFVNCSVAIGGTIRRGLFRALRTCQSLRNRNIRNPHGEPLQG